MNLLNKTMQLGLLCDEKERVFAQLIFDGVSSKQAHHQAFGYINTTRGSKLLAGNAGNYLSALRLSALSHAVPPLIIEKQDRLHLLSTIAVQALANYQTTGEATHAAQSTKAINEINRMMGSHAALEVNVKGLILQATLGNELSSSECTDIYKRMMEGARLEAQDEMKVKQLIATKDDGGDT